MTDKCSTCGHYHQPDNDTKVCTLLSCTCDITKFTPEIKTKSFAQYNRAINSFTKVADKIRYLLEEIPQFRELTNKQFVFAYWHYNNGFCPGMELHISTYYDLTDPETIRRCKQKVVETNPDLAASDEVTDKKSEKKLAVEEWLRMQ